jgi:hypothetical protein
MDEFWDINLLYKRSLKTCTQDILKDVEQSLKKKKKIYIYNTD